jgi:hypothetical protein
MMLRMIAEVLEGSASLLYASTVILLFLVAQQLFSGEPNECSLETHLAPDDTA